VRDELESRWTEVGDFIRAQRSLARMSVRRLAELAGVSNPYLSQIERGLRRPSAEVLQQIARALRIPAEQLYKMVGILDRTQSGEATVGAAEAIARDASLTAEQRHSLLTIYDSFRRQNEAAESAPAGGC
jgi:transcriptional regulator with XRE-family HTH domain